MNPQLQAIVDELRTAQERLHALAAATAPADWSRRPNPDRWSIAECVAHLNLISAAFVPLLRRAMTGATRSTASRRYRRDMVGWLLWRIMGPPARVRVKTTAPFIPQARAPAADLVAEFDLRQDEQVALVREADGLPLSDIKVTSPFDPRIRYNMYAALTILPRHQHRHLWQAEQASAELRKANQE